jgi:predicted nucleotidyltransferase
VRSDTASVREGDELLSPWTVSLHYPQSCPRPWQLGNSSLRRLRSRAAGPKCYFAASMVHSPVIDQAVAILVREARPQRVILFGSHARGDIHTDSDIDLLVVERSGPDRRQEMVRLRRSLSPLRAPVDVVVHSSQAVEDWGGVPGTFLHAVLREGQVMYEDT